MLSAWSQARNLLCVRLDAMGDFLMTTPAIRALKRSSAERRISVLVSPSGAEVASLVRDVDEVIAYEAPWMKASRPSPGGEADLEMVERLRAREFDAAIIFTVYSQSPLPAALLCHLAGIPLRLAHCRENPYQLLTDWVQDPEPERKLRHEVRRQLDLVAYVGCIPASERLALSCTHGARQRVRSILMELGINGSDRDWLVIHPGASAASRRYPEDLFSRVVSELASRHKYRLIFTGTEREGPMTERIRKGVGRSLVGRLSLDEFAALIEMAPQLISNNTGAVHVAAAVGTPVVDLYALTNPQHTPWLVPSRVLYQDVDCRYCYKSVCPEGHHRCLRLVRPESVVDAVLDLTREVRAGTHSEPRGIDPLPSIAPGGLRCSL